MSNRHTQDKVNNEAKKEIISPKVVDYTDLHNLIYVRDYNSRYEIRLKVFCRNGLKRKRMMILTMCGVLNLVNSNCLRPSRRKCLRPRLISEHWCVIRVGALS